MNIMVIDIADENSNSFANNMNTNLNMIFRHESF